MNNLAEKFGKAPLAISDRLLKECLRYRWPGNLRELGNFTKRYLVLENEDLVIDDLRSKDQKNNATECDGAWSSAPNGGLKAMVRGLKDDAEAREIQRALENANWNRKVAAANLGISYKALLYKIKQHGILPGPDAGFGLRVVN